MAMSLLILLAIVAIAVLWFWIKSLIVMRDNTLFLALGIFFSPIPQIIYFFTKRDEMDDSDISTMKKYFMAMGAYIILIVAYVAIAASQAPAVAY
ncbi:Uncharacterised protein [Moraxella lacunata]|uniref:Uncharacterized protein n=2 Tax=Moraxella lacunata TaxID=477 RepID=A0A1V4GMJ7_MORLA|nr:hypothetical protein B5J94_12755 [Moraxella lacunata]STZ00094.1 Uncharacterised protein [Moraxella lacunata]